MSNDKIKLTSEQHELIRLLARRAGGSEEKLAALPYHIEWVVNGPLNEGSKDAWDYEKVPRGHVPSGIAALQRPWLQSAGPFVFNDSGRSNRVEALRLAVQHASKDYDADVVAAAQEFYKFLSGQ